VGVRSCQPWYWSLSALQIPLAVLCTGLVARRLWLQHCKRISDGDGYHPDELHFGKAELVTYPAIALVAGVIAGLLGIGGPGPSCLLKSSKEWLISRSFWDSLKVHTRRVLLDMEQTVDVLFYDWTYSTA
jgi:hypothetical protein